MFVCVSGVFVFAGSFCIHSIFVTRRKIKTAPSAITIAFILRVFLAGVSMSVEWSCGVEDAASLGMPEEWS